MDDHRKLQLTQLNILKDVANICEKEGLKYYLIGGTLLGAVRHNGFIPWDDDIDLVMFRKDYDLLFNIIREKYSEKYFVQRFETDKNYTRYIMKVRLNGTKHVEKENSNISMHQGIYIDIFPLDYVVVNEKKLEKRGKKLRKLFALKNIKHKSLNDNKLKSFISKCLYPIMFFISDSHLNKKFYKVCESDNNIERDYVTNFASHFKWKKQLFPKSFYGEGVFLTFEDEKFRCPNNYLDILERLYGKNYMELPPIEKRETHKIIEVDFGEYEI